MSRVSIFSIRDSWHEREVSRREDIAVIKSDTNLEGKEESASKMCTTFSRKGRPTHPGKVNGHTPHCGGIFLPAGDVNRTHRMVGKKPQDKH